MHEEITFFSSGSDRGGWLETQLAIWQCITWHHACAECCGRPAISPSSGRCSDMPRLCVMNIPPWLCAAINQLVHHGMIYVPTGYTYGPDMFRLDAVPCQRVQSSLLM